MDNLFKTAVLAISAVILASCSGGYDGALKPSARVYGPNDKIPEGGGVYKVGNPYVINGIKYYPREDPNYDRTGVASWYGADFHGRKTANGEIYDMKRYSAAHRTMPLPSYAKVTNLTNNRSVIVRVNDRGPYAHDREIDMSKKAALSMGFTRDGTTRVRVRYLGRAPLHGDGNRLVAANRQLEQGQNVQIASLTGDAAPPAAEARPRLKRKYRRRAPPQRPSHMLAKSYTPPSPTTLAPSGNQQIYVQAASFRDPESANYLKTRLARIGSAFVEPAMIGNRTLYRVRLGPIASEAVARDALLRVRQAGHMDARIIVH